MGKVYAWDSKMGERRKRSWKSRRLKGSEDGKADVLELRDYRSDAQEVTPPEDTQHALDNIVDLETYRSASPAHQQQVPSVQQLVSRSSPPEQPQPRERPSYAPFPRKVSYEIMLSAQEKLFGNSNPTFLEMIVAEPVMIQDQNYDPFFASAQYSLAFDVLNTRFGQFAEYPPKRYEEFLLLAARYYHKDEYKPGALERIFSVMKGFIMHQEGLPSIADIAATSAYKKRWFGLGTLLYRFKEQRADKKLADFRAKLFF